MPDSTHPAKPGKNLSCMEMLQLILEGDATPEQQQEFTTHMDECMPCYKTYHLETALKMLIKSKCNGHGAPPELIEKIKTQISQNMPH